jgi:DNA-binding transcriptional regulator YiaG
MLMMNFAFHVHLYASITQFSVSELHSILFQVQQRLQLAHGRKFTYQELAQLAGTSERTMSEWMRGATSPMAMTALLNLLSQLPPAQAAEVLSLWHQSPLLDAPVNAAAVSDTH